MDADAPARLPTCGIAIRADARRHHPEREFVSVCPRHSRWWCCDQRSLVHTNMLDGAQFDGTFASVCSPPVPTRPSTHSINAQSIGAMRPLFPNFIAAERTSRSHQARWYSQFCWLLACDSVLIADGDASCTSATHNTKHSIKMCARTVDEINALVGATSLHRCATPRGHCHVVDLRFVVRP